MIRPHHAATGALLFSLGLVGCSSSGDTGAVSPSGTFGATDSTATTGGTTTTSTDPGSTPSGDAQVTQTGSDTTTGSQTTSDGATGAVAGTPTTANDTTSTNATSNDGSMTDTTTNDSASVDSTSTDQTDTSTEPDGMQPGMTQDDSMGDDLDMTDPVDMPTDTQDEPGDEPSDVPVVTPTDAPGEVLAFPGAEGFGRNTTGGRGGEVVYVTNLNDSGAGSFRDAVSQSNRIVVFEVGGVINITERIVIHSSVTVAGQTAPGGGITIYGNGVAFNGDSGNNIIRYIRIRMGKNGDSEKDAVAVSEGQDYMFDHVSISWGRDGTLDVNGSGIDNLSFQNSIISQGINNSNHSTGGLMQSGKWSVIRSLYIDNKTRNPKARGTHEFINSVLYNWSTHGYIMGDTSGVSESNLVGNYFIYGPSSDSDSHITNTTPTFYVYGDDNWVDSNKNGTLDGSLLTDYKTATLVNTPFDYPAGVENKLSAADALTYVLANAGASIVRDAVDEMLINQVLSYGTEGQIINTEDDNGIPGNVGEVAGGTPPTDTDRDGMPDDWETTRGLNPNSADDGGDDDSDGYTNIEEYLSCLVGEGDC